MPATKTIEVDPAANPLAAAISNIHEALVNLNAESDGFADITKTCAIHRLNDAIYSLNLARNHFTEAENHLNRAAADFSKALHFVVSIVKKLPAKKRTRKAKRNKAGKHDR
jgi:hypothetical protein